FSLADLDPAAVAAPLDVRLTALAMSGDSFLYPGIAVSLMRCFRSLTDFHDVRVRCALRCGIEPYGGVDIHLLRRGQPGWLELLGRRPMEAIMNTHPLCEDLHPTVYRSIIGLTIWLVLSIWLLFDRGAYVGLNLAIITVFFVIAVGVPLVLAFTWRRNSAVHEGDKAATSFREWAGSEFATFTGGLSGRGGAVQNPLPNAAVPIGLTTFWPVVFFYRATPRL